MAAAMIQARQFIDLPRHSFALRDEMPIVLRISGKKFAIACGWQ